MTAIRDLHPNESATLQIAPQLFVSPQPSELQLSAHWQVPLTQEVPFRQSALETQAPED